MNKEQKAAKKAAKRSAKRKAYVKSKNQNKSARSRFIKFLKAQRRMNIARSLQRIATAKPEDVASNEVDNTPATSDGSGIKLDAEDTASNK